MHHTLLYTLHHSLVSHQTHSTMENRVLLHKPHNTPLKSPTLYTTTLITTIIMLSSGKGVEGIWCVARSGASDEVLKSVLDYACAAGADCTPLQPTGLCFLPNTIQAHASYAFNSFFQRNNMVSGSCDFSSSATIAKSDPSYGACVYPSSPSNAGSITTTTGKTPTVNPSGISSPFGSTTTPFSPPNTSSGTIGGGSATNPDMGPPIPTTSDSATTVLNLMLILLLSSLSLF